MLFMDTAKETRKLNNTLKLETELGRILIEETDDVREIQDIMYNVFQNQHQIKTDHIVKLNREINKQQAIISILTGAVIGLTGFCIIK